MEQDIEEESLFRRIEGWYVENDLHIWYGFVSLISIGVLLFIFSREMSVTDRLKDQVASLQADLAKSQLINIDLRTENEKQRTLYLLPSLTTSHDGLDKTASKVNDKIVKVQDALIDKAVNQPTKVKTETVTTTVEVKTVVNKELNAIMKDSYCTTVPTAKECAK